MMKKLCLLITSVGMAAPVFANDYGNYTKEELRKLCEFQKQSIQRKYNGTPACDELRRRGG